MLLQSINFIPKYHKFHERFLLTKGQLISEWVFDVINFTKKKKKKKQMTNFCPRIYKMVKSTK